MLFSCLNPIPICLSQPTTEREILRECIAIHASLMRTVFLRTPLSQFGATDLCV